MYSVHTSMYLVQTSIYQYVLDLYSTEACLTGFRGAHRDANMRMPDVQLIHADDEHGNQDPCQEDDEFFESRPDAQPYSYGPCSGRCCDYIWLCGMGVSAVQGCDACQMLSLQSTKEALSFLQPTGLLYFDTYWYIPVRTFYILVHTWSL